MNLAFAEPRPETWADRQSANVSDREGSGERAGLALPFATAEAQGVTAVEALAWVGVALWGGGLVWLVVSDLVSRRSRQPVAARDEDDGAVGLAEDPS